MSGMRRKLCLLAAGLLVPWVVGGALAQPSARDQPPADLKPLLEAALKTGPEGITAIVARNGKELYRLSVGNIDRDTQYPVASASKWLTAALLMTAVDEGRLSLDAPISTVLPEFKDAAGEITLRELLAQTAGDGSLLNGVDMELDPRITLRKAAEEVAARPLEDPPGKVFKYGGPHFQIAGALLETVTGKLWADLFNERIAVPLGMTHTYWRRLPTVPPAETLDPMLQGGAVTTADDYMKFLTMIAARGAYDGKQILSKHAVDEMETAQTLGKPMVFSPEAVFPNAQYALGNWCDVWGHDGHCTRASSPGAFGTWPWVDFEHGLYGIFFTKYKIRAVSPSFQKAELSIIAANQ